MTSILDAALAYAQRGWPVFPCRPDKTPLTKHGVMDATTNEKKIKEWFTTNPFANVAIDVGGAGMMVLDLDPGYDMDQLEDAVGELPDTLVEATTPRGGKHLFYALDEGEVVPPSVSKIAKHVDVRSFNSYVLVWPSRTHDGEYTWSEGFEKGAKPAYRTDKMVEACRTKATVKSAHRDDWIIEPDLEDHVSMARVWLRDEAKIAVEGEGGDATCYATAAYMKSLGLSEPMALQVMWEEWNPRCIPPWSSDEYEHFEAKVRNAYSYNTSPPGNLTHAYKAELKAQAFQSQVTAVQREEGSRGKELQSGRFRIVDWHGAGETKAPEWLLKDTITERSYGLIIGAPGSYKSFIALDMAMSLAAGVETTWSPALDEPGTVLYVAGEGRGAMVNRMKAWALVHNGGEPVEGFYLMDPVPMAGTEDIDAFITLALAMNPDGYDLVVIDTVGRAMMGLNENAQEDASKFTHLVERLQYGLMDAAVLAVHHTGHKDKDRARGSSVFQADADCILVAEREPKSDIVTLTMSKQKDATEWERPVVCKAKDVLVDGLEGTTSLALYVHKDETKYGKVSRDTPSQSRHSTAGHDEDKLIDELALEVFNLNPKMSRSGASLAEDIIYQGTMTERPIYSSAHTIRKSVFARVMRDPNSNLALAYDPTVKKWAGHNITSRKKANGGG